ncbi:aminoacyl-tRNA hydrolase [bacterium]|nr:MAG: aminoacyl-tRNA hydrolase [bacterium]
MSVEPATVPEADYTISFVRSAGPGGQNVNKVATAAQLRFDLQGTRLLNEAAKARLRVLAGRRVTDEGSVLIVARNHRTQEGNRREALARLQALIDEARIEPRIRRATRPTKASKERRLTSKARTQRTKRMRTAVRGDE